MIWIKRKMQLTDAVSGEYLRELYTVKRNKNTTEEIFECNQRRGLKIRRKKDESSIGTLSWIGNDYLVFDPNHNELELDQANVKMICDRNEGLALTEFWKDRS